MKRVFWSIAVVFVSMMVSCGTKGNQEDYQIENVVLSEPPALDTKAPPSPPPPNRPDVKFLPPEVKNDEEIVEEPMESIVQEGDKEIQLHGTIQKQLKIIKDGNISIQSKDITLSKKRIDDLVKNLNAYYETEELQNNEQSVKYELTIRIPSRHFEKAITALENSQDEILSKNIQARDVTEEFSDLEIRLRNKRDFLQRYKELLSRAVTVKEILSIEENIRTLVEEIESAEGRIKYLTDQVAYSTLNVSLLKDKEFVYKAEKQDSFAERLKKSISGGWTSIVDFVVWLIAVWPFILLIYVSFVLGKWIMKRRRIKKENI